MLEWACAGCLKTFTPAHVLFLLSITLHRYWTYCQVAESDDWDEGDSGGFECVMPAEDEDNPEVVAAYDPEV